jgi:hypothetical protein
MRSPIAHSVANAWQDMVLRENIGCRNLQQSLGNYRQSKSKTRYLWPFIRRYGLFADFLVNCRFLRP